MNHVMERVLFMIVIISLMMPGLSFSENINDAIEPSVTGSGAIDLLDGDTMDAWKVPSTHWYVDEGKIVGHTGAKELEIPEWLYTRQRFSDFEFTCELKLTGDDFRNTGIYYRVNTILFKGHRDEEDEEGEEDDWEPFEAPSGYEFDAGFHDPTEENYWGSLGDWYARPYFRIFADQTIINSVYKPEKWNRLTFRARGNRLEYWINGIKVMDYSDQDPKASREGVIGFQIHDGSVMKVEYRNIRVLPLEP